MNVAYDYRIALMKIKTADYFIATCAMTSR